MSSSPLTTREQESPARETAIAKLGSLNVRAWACSIEATDPTAETRLGKHCPARQKPTKGLRGSIGRFALPVVDATGQPDEIVPDQDDPAAGVARSRPPVLKGP
jgi:hypothetical protein